MENEFVVRTTNDILNSLINNDSSISKKEVWKRTQASFYNYIIQVFKVAHHELAPNARILQDFLENKLLVQAHHHFSKSYFLMSLDSTKIYGFTTIRMEVVDISNLSNNQKRKLLAKGKSPKLIDNIPVFLIDQIAKNSDQDIVHGNDILDVAINEVNEAQKLIGGVVVLYAINIPDVIKMYQDYGFIPFGTPSFPQNSHTVTYQPIFLRISE